MEVSAWRESFPHPTEEVTDPDPSTGALARAKDVRRRIGGCTPSHETGGVPSISEISGAGLRGEQTTPDR